MDSNHDQDAPVTEADIQAYVDGELSPARRAAVSAYLAANPEEAARAADYQMLNLALHREFPLEHKSALTLEQAALAAKLSQAARRSRSLWQRSGRLAAGLAVVAVSMIVGWHAYERYATPEPSSLLAFAEKATDAHRHFAGYARPASPVVEQGTDGDDVVRWLSQRADDQSIGTPDLSEHGFELARERIIEASAEPTIQLLYRNHADDTYLSLIVGRNADEAKTAFTYVADGGLSLFYWQQGHYAFAISSRLGREALLAIAESVSGAMVGGTQAAPDTVPDDPGPAPDEGRAADRADVAPLVRSPTSRSAAPGSDLQGTESPSGVSEDTAGPANPGIVRQDSRARNAASLSGSDGNRTAPHRSAGA